MALLAFTSIELFCAHSSSWSGGEGDGPGLCDWDLLVGGMVFCPCSCGWGIQAYF